MKYIKKFTEASEHDPIDEMFFLQEVDELVNKIKANGGKILSNINIQNYFFEIWFRL